LESKKALILAGGSSSKDIQDNDLLSLLSESIASSPTVCWTNPPAVKANMSEDPSKRMSDAVIMDQVTTFLFAGSDTTALAISWCLHLLSLNSEVQERLRQELISTAYKCRSPTLDACTVESLPLLDAVVRETLRINSVRFFYTVVNICEAHQEIARPWKYSRRN
jgi:hypothetical protein